MKLHSPASVAAVLIGLAMALVVAWMLVSRGPALALAKSSPELALRFNASDPEALARINEYERDPLTKAARARKVLQQRPFDGRAYRHLAEVEQDAGSPRAAIALYRIALRYTPRDRLAQAWAADDALYRGAYLEAMDRTLLLADMDATLWPRLLPYLQQQSLREDAWSRLVERMLEDPPWRSQLLASWQRRAPDGFDAVMLALEAGGARLTPAERELWVQQLVASEHWTSAYLAWVGGLEASTRPVRAGVFNGAFEAEPAGHFDWELVQDGDSRKDLLATEDARAGRALRVGFKGRPGAKVAQILVLPPGEYEFAARARVDHLRSELGLAWSVGCVGTQIPLGSSAALRASGAWQASGFRFVVPEACPAQRLAFGVPDGSAIDRRTEGVVWLDDIAVVPVGVAAKAPGNAVAHGPVTGLATTRGASADRAVNGIPAAVVLGVEGPAVIQRRGRQFPAEIGTVLATGDHVSGPADFKLELQWRNGCRTDGTVDIVDRLSPCPPRTRSPPGQLRPRAIELVRASLLDHPDEPGSNGFDLPVGP